MRLDDTHRRPALLMLSDHFPDPDGCGRAARAWHLLCYASVTHRVYLSAVADRPVNLRLWRRVAQRAERIQLSASNWRWITPNPYSGEAITWASQQSFHAVLTTSPNAWPDDPALDATWRLCDLSQDMPAVLDAQVQPTRGLDRLLRPGRWRGSWQVKVAKALAQSDQLLVTSDTQAVGLHEYQSKVVTIADNSAASAWTSLFTTPVEMPGPMPTLTVLPVQPTPVRQAA